VRGIDIYYGIYPLPATWDRLVVLSHAAITSRASAPVIVKLRDIESTPFVCKVELTLEVDSIIRRRIEPRRGEMLNESAIASGRTLPRYARLAFVPALARLTWIAFHSEYGYVPLLSDINLAIHEFGHMLFMPFGIPVLGRTMVILGGSLTQVMFPFVFVGYFMRKGHEGARRDLLAAMVCLWWAAINLLSVAIYCADSRAGQLMLIDGSTGQESDAHDWYNLLSQWGLLEHDTAIARWMRAIAWLACIVSIIVAFWSERVSLVRTASQQES
jgi:hypothetical protein